LEPGGGRYRVDARTTLVGHTGPPSMKTTRSSRPDAPIKISIRLMTWPSAGFSSPPPIMRPGEPAYVTPAESIGAAKLDGIEVVPALLATSCSERGSSYEVAKGPVPASRWGSVAETAGRPGSTAGRQRRSPFLSVRSA
jgi:hypothetical protein